MILAFTCSGLSASLSYSVGAPHCLFHAIIYGLGILTFVSVIVCGFVLGVKK